MLLLNTLEFEGSHVIKLDSTLEDISRNKFTSRMFRAFKRIFSLTYILLKKRPKSALIFCGHGWGFVEKGLMVFYMNLFGVESVIAPNSGLILDSFRKKTFRRFARKVFNSSKYVICQGEFWRETFSPFVKDQNKLQIVKNWLSKEDIESELPSMSFPERNHINLVYLGWLEEYKGISDLIEAVKICKSEGLSIKLDIWGEGSDRKKLSEHIAKHDLHGQINLCGWASATDKEKLFSTQSIMVLPSYYEGMPNVVLEAMAHGLPVIATKISTLPELIEHGENGFLSDTRNPNNLASLIKELGLDPLLQQKFRDEAKARLKGHEAWRASKVIADLLGFNRTDTTNKARILILSDWFEPAFKGGGPITSCYNFCVHFNSDYDIDVITSNTDFRSSTALPVISDSWIKKDYGVNVYYSSGMLPYLKLLLRIRRNAPEITYLQGIFSLQFGILPLVLSKLGLFKSKFIVAPRGMLQSGAIGQKRRKKVLYLSFARFLRLFKNVHFQATDSTEMDDIVQHTTINSAQISLLPNFPNVSNNTKLEGDSQTTNKVSGRLKLIYYSRVSPKKNLEFYLDVLSNTFAGEVELGIIGPIEDEVYWHSLKSKIKQLPENVKVNYYGPMPLLESLKKIQEHHFMVLPTLGENYGHVIVESFSVGVPVVISTNTPWRNLSEKNLGWDLDLDLSLFQENLTTLLQMDNTEYQKLSTSTLTFVESEIKPEIIHLKNQYETVLNKIIV